MKLHFQVLSVINRLVDLEGIRVPGHKGVKASKRAVITNPKKMSKRFIIFIITLLTTIGAKALPTETYYLGTTVVSGYDDDSSYGPFNIGFTFNYYGTNYTQFYINSNGMILFGAGSSESGVVTIPNAVAPNNYIAPFWDDLVVDPSGKILYKTIGITPPRKLVIQFTNMGFYTYPVILGTFQVILYETSNKIQTQYRLLADNNSTRTHGGTATIGLENSAGNGGTLYAYQNSSAVSSGKAISYTPPGPVYTINPNSSYDGVYLTTDLTTPEPGIPLLLSPYENALIGADYTFQWTSASYATNYELRISPNSDLSGAVTYDAGTSLSYTVSGLTLDQTYYWGVYASNSTGITWCEIIKFYTSSAPPLTPVPQSIWTEQFQDITINLLYTGGDATAKTAVITTLPAPGQGELYQYNAGARGSKITTFPATITDAGKRVIYSASGINGVGVGNFNFLINDIHGDSPEATITVNVSPPGVPDVLYVAKNTNVVEIQFDMPMADPAGKQNQFTVKVNSVVAGISSAGLKPGDPNTIILTLSTPLAGGESVTVAYTQGTITGNTGGYLFSFTEQPVTLLTQIITFSQSLSKKYSDSPLTLNAIAGSGLGLTYSSSNMSVATASTNILTFHAVGSSEITARQAGNATWAPANYTKTLDVAKGDQTISFSALPSKTYGNTDFSLTATASSGLTVSFASDNSSVATVTGNNVHITGAGSAVITTSQAGNSLWNGATPVTQTLTVNKATLTVTADALNKVYGSANPALTYTYSGWVNGTETIDTPPTASTTVTPASPAGVYTGAITTSGGVDNNYDFTYVASDFTVTKADQTITFDPIPVKGNGDPDFTPSVSASSGLAVTLASGDNSVATISGDMIHITGPGTTLITATQPGNQNYNPAPDVSQPITVIITHASQTISFGVLPEKTYMDPDFIPVATASSGLELVFSSSDNTIALVTGNIIHIIGAGTATITASQPGDNTWLPAVPVDQELTILKAPQTITVLDIPQRLLVGDSYTLKAVSSSGFLVLFRSSDELLATVSESELTGVSKGTIELSAYEDGNQNWLPAETLNTVEIYSTHKDIINLFTPNGDGINDQWELPELATWGKCEVKVYSRSGKLVFADDNYNNLWDGTSNGAPVPEGAYYFIIKTENEGLVKGTVNVVR